MTGVRVAPVPVPRSQNVAWAPTERVRRLLESPAAVAVEGPGGTGKTVLLRELAEAHRRAGRTVVDARSAPDPDELVGEVAVLVDDAHRLDARETGRIVQLLGHPRASVSVAFRPWPRPPALTTLIGEMGSDRNVVVLRHADRPTVLAWARATLGPAVPDAFVDTVLRATGGHPGLVHRFLEAAADLPQPPAAGEGPAVPVLPRAVLDRVRADVAALDVDTHAVLHALAAGAPLDGEVVGEVLEVSPRQGTELLARARSSGWLLPGGELVPLARRVLLDEAPPEETRALRRQLLGRLLDRGEEPLDLARALAADEVRDPRAARLLTDRGSAALSSDPALAGELLAAAASTGARPAELAARRAQAAALCGDLDTALQLADEVLVDENAPDRPRAAGVTAAVLARRGLLARSAELFRMAGPARSGSAALALLATGSLAEAAALLGADGPAPGGALPTMLGGAEELMAEGVLQSLRSGPDAGADFAAALSTLTRAAGLLEPVGRLALLPDTPAALAALTALHYGELSIAESVLRRAVAADVGGPACRARHHLLLAWTAMLRGHTGRAREHITRAHAGCGGALEPRDELYLRALEVGLARRESDVPALVQAWVRAREAVLRHPVELFALLPLGELVVAAARLEETDHLLPHVTAAQTLLDRLGRPQLWATPLHWSAAQAAIMSDDPEALRPHAAALVAAARTSPYAAVLARAGRMWLRVLTGDVDAAAVVETAERLAAVGLAWDGSRLSGQAAVRTADARDRSTLLGSARALAEAHGLDGGPRQPAPARDVPADPADGPGGHLSEREREVARLVLTGQTYREIGGQLFISAKTVEHHVSRMRQRLGATNRSDLLARLRAELAAAG
jgi:DNA-binding NarL/FixJ family response regulator